jgi:hypothetical protein
MQLRAVIPKPVRSQLGHVWRSCEAPFYYRRAQRILRDYTEHYEKARAVFRSGNNTSCLSGFNIEVVSPTSDNRFMQLSDDYKTNVETVAASVRTLLSQASECSFFPPIPASAIREQTSEITEVRDGKLIAIQLKNPLRVEGLEDLCAALIEHLEEHLFGCYVMIDKVYVYRNPTSRQTPQGSWLWHYDNHPNEVLKLMIYLNDVEEDSAPFQYLRSVSSQTPVRGLLSPLYGESRVDPVSIEERLANGFESHNITGPQGTLILFDNNIIHKANLATKGHRDVLTLQLRPTTRSLRPFIDPEWTGSFQHAPFNRDPNDYRPTTKRLRHFS